MNNSKRKCTSCSRPARIAYVSSEYKVKADKVNEICIRIYNARNVTRDEQALITCLKEIDEIYRDANTN